MYYIEVNPIITVLKVTSYIYIGQNVDIRYEGYL